MKYLFILLLFPLSLFAQKKPIFKIDSMTIEGIILDKDWIWHTGDNPEWAKADFDDSNWESIKPYQSFFDSPQLDNAERGWFRIHIDVDSMLLNKPLMPVFYTIGASEIYLNEKLVKKVGIVSKNPNIEKTFTTPIGLPFIIVFSKHKANVIAIRYSLTHGNFYFPKFAYTKYSPIFISLQDAQMAHDAQMALIKQLVYFVILMGFFFGLAFTHFSFYYYLPIQKANLLFGLAMLVKGIAFLTDYFLITDLISVSGYTILIIIRCIAFSSHSLLLVLAIHSYLKQKLTNGFWVIVSILVCVFAFQFTDINTKLELSIYEYSFAIPNLYYLFILRRTIKAGNNDGLMIYYTGIICFIGLVLRPTTDTLLLFGINYPWIPLMGDALLYLTYFSITLGMSLTLARDFAKTDTSLQVKEKEVQQLSNEKLRIAADMHDDIGSDLSALNLKAGMIRQKVKSGKQPISEIDNLVDFTRDIAKKVREVIWTVNARHDSLSSVVNYFDTYADDFFEPTNITVRTSLPKDIPQIDINGENRKMLLMCFKEALNNVLKHAKANELNISFTTDNALFTISIQDNGVGFNPVLLRGSTAESNGLMNMQERMTGIGGQCRIQTSPQGTVVVFSLPI